LPQNSVGVTVGVVAAAIAAVTCLVLWARKR
jgi:hypothetical protein